MRACMASPLTRCPLVSAAAWRCAPAPAQARVEEARGKLAEAEAADSAQLESELAQREVRTCSGPCVWDLGPWVKVKHVPVVQSLRCWCCCQGLYVGPSTRALGLKMVLGDLTTTYMRQPRYA